MDELTKEQLELISSLIKLYHKGVKSVAVDQYTNLLFPSGFSINEYNEIVPKLVQSNFLNSNYDAPRDGPVISLTEMAIKRYG